MKTKLSNDMKTYLECLHEAAEIIKDIKVAKYLEMTLSKSSIDLMQKAAEIYAEQSNSHKHSVSGKRPTPELFCKVHSEMYGETIDKLRQLDGQIFDGEELYELCLNFYQAACASCAVDKTVSADCWCHRQFGTSGNCECKEQDSLMDGA